MVGNFDFQNIQRHDQFTFTAQFAIYRCECVRTSRVVELELVAETEIFIYETVYRQCELS